MKRTSIKAISKASLSLACMLNAKPRKLPNSAMLSAGLRSLRSTPIQAEDKARPSGGADKATLILERIEKMRLELEELQGIVEAMNSDPD